MSFSAISVIFCTVIGGLGLFMLGMKHMSEGLQIIAGDRLRRLISAVTNNRFLAVGIGTLVTVIIQSSSVTTVMVVGFVNSGFMTLAQAIGVVMGANIGTTITGWILVLEVGKYGLPLLGAAALVYRFSQRESWRHYALVVMGIGMVFFGLELMKDGFQPLRQSEDFMRWFHAFRADTYFGVIKCALVGCILTCIVQSSSATLGITIGLATTGVIPFHTAAALVLGENIGTTITAFLASLGATTNAKRAAYAHVLFNIIGVLWVTALFSYYIHYIDYLLPHDPATAAYRVDGQEIPAAEIFSRDGSEFYRTASGAELAVVPTFPHVTAGIAMVHSIFNILNVILWLPLVSLLARFLERVVPDKPFKEAPHLTRLDSLMLETPAIGIEQSRVEIIRMADTVKKMLKKLRRLFADGAPSALPAAAGAGETGEPVAADERTEAGLVRKVFHREEVLDIMQKEVTIFLTDLLAENASHEIADEGRRQLRMADELESVSDYVAAILKLKLRLSHAQIELPAEEREGLLSLHDRIEDFFRLVERGFEERHADVITKVRAQNDAITHHFRDLREDHLQRVSQARMEPLLTVCYTNMLNSYRRVKDHIFNFAEAMAGVK